ncbi:unannotated protein [freshwater metagenome]|uniref:Unannotated protein n=1 Tax=freshwater metagenome TaxID=449393 RepID=A0A6J6FL84_9ZZZZ
MVCLIPFLETAQNGNRVFDTGFTDINLLETAFERRILFDVFAILVERRGPDQTKFTACEHRFEHVGGCYGTFSAARTHQGVKFIYEGDDATVRLINFFQHCLEAFLKLAAILGSRDECREVERDDFLALEAVGDIAGDNALGEALDDGGLSNARFTNENGVVLCSAG